MITTDVRRPVMRYHGGKWRIAPWIIGHFPPHRVYTEVFGGGGSILMRKRRVYAEVYNDLDQNIVGVFRVMRDPEMSTELERRLRYTPFAREELDLAYEPSDDPIEQARRTITLSLQGYGSDSPTRGHRTGFRVDSNRSHTTPAHDWANYPNHIAAFCRRLQGVVIENRPAVQILQQHDRPDALHYVDPPYVLSTRSTARHGYQYEMTDDQHRELAAVLHSLVGIPIISGYRSDLYDELYSDWRRVDFRARAEKNRPTVESLWISPQAEHSQTNIEFGD